MGEKEYMRIICPTCKYLESPNHPELCILHMNPDKQKYFCLCEGGVTKEELKRYYKLRKDEHI